MGNQLNFKLAHRDFQPYQTKHSAGTLWFLIEFKENSRKKIT